MKNRQSYIAVPPGATIKEQLQERNMSQKEFAVRMSMSEKHISKLINGEVQLTQETAARLELVLGVPASFWNKFEAIYREELRKIREQEALDADAELAGKFPYSEMTRLGWVSEANTAREKADRLRRYFEIVSLSLLQNEQVMKISCRRLVLKKKSDLGLMAWAQESRILAREIKTAPFNMKKLLEVLPILRKMRSMRNDKVRQKIVDHLAECGIAVVFLPCLNKSPFQGATIFDGKKIVIGLTEDNTRTDAFWFNLFHELAHVVLGHIGKEESVSDEDEKSADIWAADFLQSNAAS